MIKSGQPEATDLAEVRAWGHTSHGLCTSGVLDLGGGHSASYPQPVGPLGGRTLLVQAAHAPGSGMSAPEAAAEAAEGRRWLDYALLSGSRSQYCSVPTDVEWIYIDSTGTRWGVTMETSFTNLQGTITFNFTFTEFGVFADRAARVESRTVVKTSIGQSAPSIAPDGTARGASVTGETVAGSSTPTVGNTYLLAHAPVDSLVLKDSSGSPKTLTLNTHYTLNKKRGEIKITNLTTGGPFTGPLKADYTRIIATIEVMDATKTGTRAILRVRDAKADETWNGYSGLPTTAEMAARIQRPLGWLECVVTGDGEDIAIAVDILADRETTFGTEAISGGEDHTETCHTWIYTEPPIPDQYAAILGHERYTDQTQTLNDRIVGYMYNSSGVAVPVTWTYSIATTGSNIRTVDDDFYEVDSTQTYDTTITLAWGAHSIEFTNTYTVTGTESGTCDDPNGNCEYDVGPDWCDDWPKYSFIDALGFADWARFDAVSSGYAIGEGVLQRVFPYAYSPTVFGGYSFTFEPGDPTEPYARNFVQAIHRNGLDTSEYSRAYGHANQYITYGSDQPVDGLVVFASNNPVCYV